METCFSTNKSDKWRNVACKLQVERGFEIETEEMPVEHGQTTTRRVQMPESRTVVVAAVITAGFAMYYLRKRRTAM